MLLKKSASEFISDAHYISNQNSFISVNSSFVLQDVNTEEIHLSTAPGKPGLMTKISIFSFFDK